MATNSIVDYLSSAGKDSSFSARQSLAAKMGIQNYTGSASQNTSLLNSLRQLLTKPETAPRPLATPTTKAFGPQPFIGPRQLPQQPAQQASQTATRTLPGATGSPTGGAKIQPPQPQMEQPQQPQEQPQQSNYQKVFDDTIMAMMKAAQGAGDEDLQAKRNAIINARFNASNQSTPEELRVLSPQAQSSLRNLDSAGLEDQLGGVSAALKGRQEQRATQIETGEKLLKYLKPEEKSYADRYGTGVIGEYNFYAESEKNAGRKPLDFSSYQTLDANRKRSITNNYLGGGLSKDQFNRLNTIADNARQDTNIKDFPAVRASYETARGARQSQNSAGDIVLMRMLAKITDPTTGVREEEYKTFKDAAGTLPRYGVQLTKQMVGKGQLTEAGRNSLLLEVGKIYKQRESAYNNSVKTYGTLAKKNGGEIEDVMPVYLAPEVKGQAETKVVAGKTYEKVDGGWKLK